MNDKELYQQKFQAQLNEWRAEIDKLKAKAAEATSDAQLALNRHIEELEALSQNATAKLAELSSAGEEAWDSVKKGAESAWDTLKTSFSDAAAKFKK